MDFGGLVNRDKVRCQGEGNDVLATQNSDDISRLVTAVDSLLLNLQTTCYHGHLN